MSLLAFDTTMRACSAAVLADGRLTRVFEDIGRGHAEALFPMIGRVMAEAGVAYADLTRIAVTVGPGSFTGVRAGVAAARGLALALKLPLVSATSLAVMARQVLGQWQEHLDTLAVAADARRGEVYIALFDRSGRALSDTLAVDVTEAAGLLPKGGAILVVGSGGAALAEAAAAQGKRVKRGFADLQPDAGVLAEMTANREPDSGPVRPLYLRPPDARPQAHKSVTRR